MSGRYTLISNPARVFAEFDVPQTEEFPPRYNIAPSQPIAVIRHNPHPMPGAPPPVKKGSSARAMPLGRRECALMRWGFIPGWMGREKGRPLAMARAETVDVKASFKSAFKRRRCLMPADGFYEWRGEAGARQPYYVRPIDGRLIAFAAIWETAMADNGSEADTVAFLTVEAGPDLARIHHREPAVIDHDDYALWLEADERDAHQLKPLLRARAAGFWRAEPVSTAVNTPRHDGPDLIKPVPAFKMDLFE